jgi:predicted DNA-binding transcriptional regulator AlpA
VNETPPSYGARMGRKVDVDDLVGSAEIAKRLGIARQSVHQLQKRHSEFPLPVARLEQAQVWSWSEVEGWARATGRLR